MNIQKDYKKYREAGTRLTEKVMQACLHKDSIKNAAKLLGVLRGNELLLETEEEGAAFMDFVLNDCQVDQKTIYQAFQAQAESIGQDERNVLNALTQSYTSLFKIESISPQTYSLVLTDLLNDKQGINLLDFSLSESAVPGLLIFIRLVPFQDTHITSGVIFAFVEAQESYLLKQCKYRAKKVKSDSAAIQRFVAFFHLNRSHGMLVGYQ
jgi:hypothetical protein